MTMISTKSTLLLAFALASIITYSNIAHAVEPANPTQAALLACPVALDQIKKLQTLIDETRSQHLDPHSQEGMQATCRMLQSQMEIVDGYINDLQECKRNGIVGLQPLVQLSISSNQRTEAQFHSACD